MASPTEINDVSMAAIQFTLTTLRRIILSKVKLDKMLYSRQGSVLFQINLFKIYILNKKKKLNSCLVFII